MKPNSSLSAQFASSIERPAEPAPASPSGNRGAGIVLVMVVLAVVAIGLAAILRNFDEQRSGARAQAVADATALAAAGVDNEFGRLIAAQNGARVENILISGSDVRVEISLAGSRQSATARWELLWLPPKSRS